MPARQRIPVLATFALVLGTVAAHAQSSIAPSVLEPVTVYRDVNDAPHVAASVERAAFYGFGRAQMRDMPTSVAFNYAVAAGELSSILGPGPPLEDGIGINIHIDRRIRRWRIAARAAVQKAAMPTDVAYALRAFAMGLEKSRIEWLQNLSLLVFNTEPYAYDLPTLTRLMSRPIDVDDVIRYGLYFQAMSAMEESEALASGDDPDAAQDHERDASNSFAIGPEASADGRTMLVADPHLPFQQISALRSYFAQISSPAYDMCGLSFPGFPCIAVGFNSDFGWALTTNNPDVTDVWRAAATGNGASYPVDGVPVPIIREPITIDVWDDVTGSLLTYNDVIAFAGDREHPVLREVVRSNGSRTIWFARTTIDAAETAWQYLIRLGRCRSVTQAWAVLDMNLGGGNFLMADSSGDLGYLWSGRVPVRGRPDPGTTWAQVQNGNNGRRAWLGIHAANELPREHRATHPPDRPRRGRLGAMQLRGRHGATGDRHAALRVSRVHRPPGDDPAHLALEASARDPRDLHRRDHLEGPADGFDRHQGRVVRRAHRALRVRLRRVRARRLQERRDHDVRVAVMGQDRANHRLRARGGPAHLGLLHGGDRGRGQEARASRGHGLRLPRRGAGSR